MFRSKADGIDPKDAEDTISRIGGELARLRTKRGERLEDIAEYLGIKSTYLYGIELGDLSIISSKRHVQSFISSYANYLGLDGEAIRDRLLPVINNLEGTRAPSGFWGFAALDRSSAVILAASALLGIFAGWSYLGDIAKLDLIAPPVTAGAISGADNVETAIAESATEITIDEDGHDAAEASTTLAGQALADLQGQAVEAERREAEQALANEELGANGDAASSQSASVDIEQASEGPTTRRELPVNVLATLVAERGGAEIHEPQNTDARVIVRALDTSWIQVSSADRTYIWTRTMQPHEMLLVPSRDDLELWAGDASGVEILLDGAPLPSLGPPGTVVRGISLAPAALEAISAEIGPEGSTKPTF